VDVASNLVYIALIGLLLAQPFDNLFAVAIPEPLLPKIKFAIKLTLLPMALVSAIELIRNIVIIARRKPPTGGA
jgi:hypothetical protein